MYGKRTAILICVALMTVVLAGNLYGQIRPYWALHRLGDELNLTKEQRDKIADIRIKYEKERISMNSELKKLRLDAAELFTDIEKNLKEIESVYKKIADIRIKMKMDRLKQRIESGKVFTAEQKEKFKELIKKKRTKCRIIEDRHPFYGRFDDIFLEKGIRVFGKRLEDIKFKLDRFRHHRLPGLKLYRFYDKNFE